jgi:hypothetical protein
MVGLMAVTGLFASESGVAPAGRGSAVRGAIAPAPVTGWAVSDKARIARSVHASNQGIRATMEQPRGHIGLDHYGGVPLGCGGKRLWPVAGKGIGAWCGATCQMQPESGGSGRHGASSLLVAVYGDALPVA